ncbi:hypothetical protein FH972_019727 [Carpinus fangiana]|uniref:AB hydrolase-1 domain-containing protein n=1 Tax=Carpinus fangiana TaxID=176857 RepID=A0A5N6RRK5_9ROSI|nr:hypothetical protein FH972_019727 [Carpinus fangiana]
MFVSHSDLLAMTRNATGLRHRQGLHPVRSNPRRQSGYYRIPHLLLPVRPRAVYGIALEEKTKNKRNDKKPAICTADELHYVSVPNSDWTLALWRYLPSTQPRNHPLLLLSGVATNAIGYDLSPESSFAHYMSGQGFDTWVLEVRGAGLSTCGMDFKEIGQPLDAMVDSSVKSSLEVGQNSAIASQIRVLSQGLANIIEEGQLSVPTRLLDLQGRFSTTLDEFQKQLDLIVKYDWDFESYLEEDLPAAVEYIRTSCKPKDGKLLAIGHSMGGILLYAMLSRCCFEGRNPGFASVATLGSSLDYTTSKSSLKLLLPLAIHFGKQADPAQALNVPVIPIGALLAAAHPLTSRPPYVLSWLNAQISAQHMMHPKLFEKLVLNNFGTVPTKLLLQLTTAFQEGGLRDRSGSFFFKDHLHKSNVPVLALAGDQDLICPPEAVYETVKLISEDLVTYKVFGEPGGAHYGHYDLVGGRLV